MCGVGIGLNFMATQPLISQWFQKHRSVAMGLGAAGVGLGGLIFSLTTHLALSNHGVRFAYVMNGIITFVILTPTTIFFRRKLLVISLRYHIEISNYSSHARGQCKVQVCALRHAEEPRPCVHLSLDLLRYVWLSDSNAVNCHLYDTGCWIEVNFFVQLPEQLPSLTPHLQQPKARRFHPSSPRRWTTDR